MIMSPAAPVLDPAMVYALPPLDHKTWLHPTTAPVPSRSQPNLAWLQLPVRVTLVSLVNTSTYSLCVDHAERVFTCVSPRTT
jgi:hypothetical protein